MVFLRHAHAQLVQRTPGAGRERVPGDGAASLPRVVRGGRESEARGGGGCASSGQPLDGRFSLAGGCYIPKCCVFGVECSVFGAHDTSLGLGLVAGIGVALIECVCVEVFMHVGLILIDFLGQPWSLSWSLRWQQDEQNSAPQLQH